MVMIHDTNGDLLEAILIELRSLRRELIQQNLVGALTSPNDDTRTLAQEIVLEKKHEHDTR